MPTTFSIETLVETMLITRLTHSTTFIASGSTQNVFAKDTDIDLTERATSAPILIVSAFDEGEEVFRSGIRRVRVEFEARANAGELSGTPTVTSAAFQSFYDEALSYLDDADAEAQMTTASASTLKVIGVIRSSQGTDRPTPEEGSLVRSRTITRTLLVSNIT